jgi:uncharacterized protein YaeQ
MRNVIITIISSVVIALLGWFVAGGRAAWDRNKVYQWLKSNTLDKPEQSHIDTITIAKGTLLPEDRVRNACMSCQNIYHYTINNKETWSVWRKQPQSVYDNLTKNEIIDRMIV